MNDQLLYAGIVISVGIILYILYKLFCSRSIDRPVDWNTLDVESNITSRRPRPTFHPQQFRAQQSQPREEYRYDLRRPNVNSSVIAPSSVLHSHYDQHSLELPATAISSSSIWNRLKNQQYRLISSDIVKVGKFFVRQKMESCSSRVEARSKAKALSFGFEPKEHRRPHKPGQLPHFHPYEHSYVQYRPFTSRGPVYNYHFTYPDPNAATILGNSLAV